MPIIGNKKPGIYPAFLYSSHLRRQAVTAFIRVDNGVHLTGGFYGKDKVAVDNTCAVKLVCAVGHARWYAVIYHAAVILLAQDGEVHAAAVGQHHFARIAGVAIGDILADAFFKHHKRNASVDDGGGIAANIAQLW